MCTQLSELGLSYVSQAGGWALCASPDTPEHSGSCLDRARQCFADGGVEVWGGCYRAVLSCAHPAPHPEEEQEEQEEKANCAYYMDLCFDYSDDAACSTMFDICFHKEEELEEDHDGEEAAESVSCVDSVRYCLSEGAEQGHCLHLILYCYAEDEGEEEEEDQGCYYELEQCIHHYSLEECAGLVEECGGEEVAHYGQELCYTNAEQCLSSPGGQHHPTCLALISICYNMAERPTCLEEMEVCLTADEVTNAACHHQLRSCLEQEEQGEQYEGVLRQEEHWAKIVRLLLSKNH